MRDPAIGTTKHKAKAGDLICARIGGDGDWMIMSVAAVDDDGFVAVIADQDGQRVAIGRLFPESRTDAPHLIISRDSLTAAGRADAVGLCAGDLDTIKVELRRRKADA